MRDTEVKTSRRGFLRNLGLGAFGAAAGIYLDRNVPYVNGLVNKIEDGIYKNKAKKTVSEKDNKSIQRYQYIKLDSRQLQQITEIAAVKLNTRSYIKCILSNNKVPKVLGLRECLGTGKFTLIIPVIIKMGFDLSEIINRDDFILVDNQTKEIIVSIPKEVKILSLEERLDKAKIVEQKEKIFANFTPKDIINELGINQQEIVEKVHKKRKLYATAKRESLEGLKTLFSLLTIDVSQKKGYNIRFNKIG